MKALVLTDKERMVVKDVTKPNINPDEVLVKVKHCGICGTDVHIFHGQPGSAQSDPPLILGHEFSGEIVEVGDNVSLLKVGDRVGIDPNIYCGKCQYCQNGRFQLCEHLEAIGVTRDGGMAEFCAVPEKNCIKLGEHVTDLEGALIEPLGCVLHGANLLPPIHSDTNILIIGAGFIGRLFLSTLILKNPNRVDILERKAERHAALLDQGATNAIQSVDGHENNYDIVIECVGKKVTSEAAIRAARKGAYVLLFGVPAPDETIEVPAFDIYSKELTISGSFINPFTMRDAMKHYDNKQIDLDVLVSDHIALEDVENILANFSNIDISKAVIDIQ
ncbi:theronine dehydrogenase [Vagococcus penaei]|uniref:Theronine dehydrogenase n=1 Tax=Vagococcus penaei TaxID=633807 RepID=A0A1Q2D4T4_9ENTE|nr:zinc-dependent alcohol dehydrogenase family protein [Vagococcus penaei]AQP53416.1 theronine dehydrogenase [Vagococcus penaei]RST98641.1 theronine dehydrogenase [Vagococcus penaei]